jgi:hypothetical protein
MGFLRCRVRTLKISNAIKEILIMSRIKYVLLILAFVGIAGCGNKEGEEQQPPAVSETPAQQEAPAQAVQKAEPPAAEPAPAPPAAPAKTVSKVVPKAPQPAPVEAPKAAAQPVETEPAPAVSQEVKAPEVPKAPEPKIVTIPNGTPMQVRLLDPLDTSVNQTGDTFRAVLDQDIDADGIIVAPRGSMLEGKLSNVTRSGRVEGRASMSLQLFQLTVGDQSYPIQTEILNFEAESTKKKDAAKVGIGAGIGAIVGAIAGGGKGAAIGAAVGGGAGGATVLATRGNEVKFEAEHVLSFALTRDLALKVR